MEAKGNKNGSPYTSIEDICAAVEENYCIQSELFYLLGQGDLMPPTTAPNAAQVGSAVNLETVDAQ